MNFPVETLLNWYRTEKRDLPWRRTRDIYRIWVSEVMLQQTQVAAATPYYLRFIAQFPTVNALAEAEEERVLKLWEGMGYYNRCRNLHRAAKIVVEQCGGMVPTEPTEFRKLPGAGPYITAAVMSIGAHHPLPAVDGNVMRVFARFSGLEEDVSKSATKAFITTQLQAVIPAERPGDFNQAMMELGALVCTPQQPRCPSCPLKKDCIALRTGDTRRLPIKAPRKKVPEFAVSVAVIKRGNKFFIQKRPAEGHLGGMWELPGGKSEADESPRMTVRRECREELGVELTVLEELARIQHGYSHFKIRMTVFVCDAGTQAVHPLNGQDHRWITVEDIPRFPFPAANHKFFPELTRYFTAQRETL